MAAQISRFSTRPPHMMIKSFSEHIGGSVCALVLASASRATTYRDKLAAEGPRGMTNRSTIPMTVHGCAG